jgi:hypothetical protein
MFLSKVPETCPLESSWPQEGNSPWLALLAGSCDVGGRRDGMGIVLSLHLPFLSGAGTGILALTVIRIERGRRQAAVAASTSFRISDIARRRLAARAAWEGTTVTALLDRIIMEGSDKMDFPGIVFRGPAHDRRAALAAGPDVWEIVSRLQELDGSEEQRIATLAEESNLYPRLIRLALDYAAEHREAIQSRVDRNRAMAEHQRHVAQERRKLLA